MNNFLDYLITLDVTIFATLQYLTACDFLDFLLPMWRDKLFWLPLYAFFITFLWLNFQRKGLLILLFVGATVGLSDFTSSSIIKPLVKRSRPCKYEASVFPHRAIVTCGNGYSFPSSHAANHFAAAVFIGNILQKKRRVLKFLLLLWATSIAFAQLYVGVHFPIDLICGALLGTIIAIVMSRWYNNLGEHNMTVSI